MSSVLYISGLKRARKLEFESLFLFKDLVLVTLVPDVIILRVRGPYLNFFS